MVTTVIYIHNLVRYAVYKMGVVVSMYIRSPQAGKSTSPHHNMLVALSEISHGPRERQVSSPVGCGRRPRSTTVCGCGTRATAVGPTAADHVV